MTIPNEAPAAATRRAWGVVVREGDSERVLVSFFDERKDAEEFGEGVWYFRNMRGSTSQIIAYRVVEVSVTVTASTTNGQKVEASK